MTNRSRRPNPSTSPPPPPDVNGGHVAIYRRGAAPRRVAVVPARDAPTPDTETLVVYRGGRARKAKREVLIIDGAPLRPPVRRVK